MTSVVVLRPDPEREGDARKIKEFIDDITGMAAEFPGHMDTTVFRPRGNDDAWRLMMTFDSPENLRRWENSRERQRFYERADGLIDDVPEHQDVTGTAQELPLARALIPFDRFVRTSVSGSALLLLGAGAALVWVNSPLSGAHSGIFGAEVTVGAGPVEISEPLLAWINEALMALFFFLMGLEIKRELLVGAISSVRQAALPAIAALGGMLAPALIYLTLNSGEAGADGWGIPMATDIAFAIGVLVLLGDRVPASLRTFLVALAIADDIGAVLVIALFYTPEIDWTALAVAAGLVAALALAGKGGISYPLFYVSGGVLVWLALFESGVHATVAGVLVAMTVPARAWLNPSQFLSRASELLDDFRRSGSDAGDESPSVLGNARQQAAIEGLREAGARAETPMQVLESRLERWVVFVILPLFALANAAVDLSGVLEALGSPVTLGVALGLLVGKPVGITLSSYLAVRLGLAELPAGVGWVHVAGVGVLAGIGFTMSLFITGLAFGGALAASSKIGIFAASLVAGAAGWAILRFSAPGQH